MPEEHATAGTNVHAIGVDLAWGARPTGLAHLVGPAPDTGRAETPWRLLDVARVGPMEGIVQWITARVPGDAPAWIAVDAPLVAHNPRGTTREAERAFARAFAPYRVAAYPADRDVARRGMELVAALADHGFSLAVPAPGAAPRHGIFETFPTAAQLHILELHRPIRYKRGTTAGRQEGLQRLALRLLMLDDPAVAIAKGSAMQELLGTNPLSLRGDKLKAHEDRMDALIAALVAAIAWRYPERLVTYGTRDDGFITVPQPPGL